MVRHRPGGSGMGPKEMERYTPKRGGVTAGVNDIPCVLCNKYYRHHSTDGASPNPEFSKMGRRWAQKNASQSAATRGMLILKSWVAGRGR